jgi:hypothetical protein
MSEQEPGQADEREAPKEKRGLDVVALRELRRARKLFKDGEPTPEANFVVATANVLALLELASAIRDHNNGSDPNE